MPKRPAAWPPPPAASAAPAATTTPATFPEPELAKCVGQVFGSSRAPKFEAFLLQTVARSYATVADWLSALGITGKGPAAIVAGLAKTVNDVEAVAGIWAHPRLVFPLAGYGWDGGDAIETTTFNLVVATSTELFAGPDAALCLRLAADCPGLALHYYHGEDTWKLQHFAGSVASVDAALAAARDADARGEFL